MDKKNICVVRMGHRTQRDQRITTHVFMVARAFGASEGILCGDCDLNVLKSIERINKLWGGKFQIKYEKNCLQFLMKRKKAGWKIIHLTMYGEQIQKKIAKINLDKSQDATIQKLNRGAGLALEKNCAAETAAETAAKTAGMAAPCESQGAANPPLNRGACLALGKNCAAETAAETAAKTAGMAAPCEYIILVGSGKVPKDIYLISDYNIAVTNQPHSEIAALAIFLDRIYDGKELDMKFEGQLKILPDKCNKVVFRGKNMCRH